MIDAALQDAPVPAVVTGNDDRASLRRLAIELGVRRHAAVGLAVGVLVAAAVYAYRVGEVLGPVRDTRASPGLFVLLAVVLAVSVALLVAVTLTVAAAVSRARDLG